MTPVYWKNPMRIKIITFNIRAIKKQESCCICLWIHKTTWIKTVNFSQIFHKHAPYFFNSQILSSHLKTRLVYQQNICFANDIPFCVRRGKNLYLNSFSVGYFKWCWKLRYIYMYILVKLGTVVSASKFN